MKDHTRLRAAAHAERLIELMARPDAPLVRAVLELLAPVNSDAATALRVVRALDPLIAARRAQQAAADLRDALSHPAVQDRLRASGDDPVARDLLWLAESLGHEA